MNIYLHNEVSTRELDSKLLLATLAASRGHQVLISDQESLIKGLVRKFLVPGIFHTKSLTPSKTKIENHKQIINSGCKITSIDEESGLIANKYDEFAKKRYGIQTLKQASAVFSWGKNDFNSLKKIYPHYLKKIYMTGSPRVDLWKPSFHSYWKRNKIQSKKPYLLVSSSFGAGFHKESVFKRLNNLEKGGYFKRVPKYKKMFLLYDSENNKLLASFINAIKYLSKNNKKKYKIIVRPHPNEDIRLWKFSLGNFSNVEIIQDDSVTAWVSNAFAVMHYNCTTAFEAVLLGKPVVSYSPFSTKYLNKASRNISLKIQNLEKLLKIINKFSNQNKSKKEKIVKTFPIFLNDRLFIDKKELASKKIIQIWEKMNDQKLSRPNNLMMIKIRLKIMKINGALGKILKKLLYKNFKIKQNYKFPPFNEKEIIEKIKILQKVLGVKEKISLEFLSDRTFLIKRVNKTVI